MADLSSLSDDELQAQYAQASAPPQDNGLGNLSDDDLRDAYDNALRTPQPVDDLGRPMPGSSPENDAWLAQSPIGHVLDAFGQGAKAGWGTDEIVHPDTAALLQKAGVLSDVKDGQTGIVKSFNDALLRPAAAGLDLAIRGAGQAYRASSAVFGGGLEAAVEAGTQIGGNQFGRGVGELGEFLLTDAGAHIPMHPEALPRGELLGRELGRTLDRAASNTEVPPAPFSLRSVGDLETSRSLGVLGTEAEWKGYAPTEDFPAGTTTSYSAPVEATPEGAPMQPYAPTLSPDVAPAAEPTNIHEAARQIAPDTFHEFDALTQDREQLSNTIAAESEALRRNAEQQMPGGDRIADLEARIQQMTPKMAADLQGRIDDIRGGWDQSTLDALGRDTPELAAMRQQLQVIDYRMRDLAPDVSAAYRSAGERFPMVEEPGEALAAEPQAAEQPGETAPTEPASVEPTPAEPVTVEGGNEAQPPAAETPAPTPEPAAPPINIAQDVAAKLQAAGRPAEEAQAAGAVQDALWRTRAEAFGGRKGTAEEMYAREAPEVRSVEPAKRRQKELAQSSQTVYRGGLFKRGSPDWYIGLFKDANASTFIHETGHEWLELMMKDALDADAPQSMRNDMATVRKYLGAEDGAKITDGQHEKFARSFERYFMEGRAPSSALARVFEQFKSWLTTIYQTVSRLRAPITDDIRDVFDRLLTTNPEARTTLAADRDLEGHVEPKTPFATIPKEPTRLAAFVRKMGGVQEESGEIKAMLGGDYRRRPGLMNSTGMTHDLMAIEAMHAGYFPGYEEQHTLPPNILLDRLREDLNGNPQYSMHDQEAADAYHEALARNSEVERLANKYGVDPTGLTHDQFFDKIAEAESTENLADSIRNTEDHLVEDFDDMHAEVRDTTEPPHYGITEPRTLEDLENEARQADDSRYGEQGADRAERPGLVGSPEGAGEVGGGQVGGVAGAEGGGGTEVRSGGAAAGDGQSAGPGEREPVSDAGEPGAEPEPALEPIDVKTEAPEFATKDDREIEKAANIRLDKINGTEDMNSALKALAEQNGDYMDARYGSAAYQTQMDIRNTRILLRLATSDLVEASKKARSMDPKAVADMLVKEQRASMVFRKLSTLSADWGHAGHELNKVMEGWESVKAVTDMLGKDRDLFQKSVAERVAAYAAMDTPEQAAKLASDLQATRYQKIKSGFLSLYINNLISGPITHMAYMTGNTVMALYRAVPETAAQATIGAIRGGTDRVYFSEILPQLYGMFKGARDGIMPAARALKSGVPELAGGKQAEFEGMRLTRQQAIPGIAGRIIETPSRAVAALHTFSYSMSYSQEIARLAARDASARGLTGTDFNAEVARLTSSPTPEMMDAATAAGMRGTLMTAPKEGFQKDLVAMTNKYLPLKMAVPFMQIGTTLLNEGVLDRTALSLLSSDARAEIMAGGASRDIRLGKIAAGTALSVAVLGLTMEQTMTGGGPSDPEKRRVWLDAGNAPYSIQIGNLNFPYRKFLGPLGPLVAATADMYEVGHSLSHEGLTQAATALAFGFSEVVASETWMSGISNLIEAIHDRGNRGEQYIRNLATSFIPFSVGDAQISRAVDPYQRRVQTILESVQNKIPFASEGLEPQIGIWGQPIRSNRLGSLTPTRVTDDPVDARLRAIGFGVSALRKDVVGIPLTEQQYTQYAITAGRMAHQTLMPLVTQPGFAELPAGVQTKAIKQVIDKSRETARALIKMQSPAIIEQATQNKMNLRTAGKGGAY